MLETAKTHIDPLKLMKILVAFLTSFMVVAGVKSGSESSPANRPRVEFENGRMSVKAHDISLKNLLIEIQDKSGIVIELKDPTAAERQSFIDFKNLLPGPAFRTILRGLNFAFFYSEKRLARVLILPSGNRIANSRSRLVNPDRFGRQVPRAGNAPTRSGAMPKMTGKNSKDSHIAAQLDAIEAMQDSDDPKSIAALGDALTDPDSRVKEAALRALEDKKQPNVTELLRRGLNDADPRFSHRSARNLGGSWRSRFIAEGFGRSQSRRARNRRRSPGEYHDSEVSNSEYSAGQTAISRRIRVQRSETL